MTDLLDHISKSFHGVPNELGVSDSEMALKLMKQQGDALAALAPRGKALDFSGIDRHLGAIADSQRVLARELGNSNRFALRERSLGDDQIRELSSQAQDAYQQRNVALRQTAESIYLQEQQIGILENLGRLMAGSSYAVTDSIDQASMANVDAIETASEINEYHLMEIEGILLDGLAQIGDAITSLSTQVAVSTLKLFHGLKHFENSSRQSALTQHHYLQGILAELKKANHSAENPSATRSLELWRFGEAARDAGVPDDAKHLFQESIKTNPLFAQNYLSLSIILFDEGNLDEATKVLKKGIAYSGSDLQIKGPMLYLRAKIERICSNPKEGIPLAEQALHIDRDNLDLWYELAYLYALDGNDEQAIYFMKNLFFVSKKKNLQYHQKLLLDPVFFPYLDRVLSFHSIKNMPNDTGSISPAARRAEQLDLAVTHLGEDNLDLHVRPDAMLVAIRDILVNITAEMDAIRAQLTPMLDAIYQIDTTHLEDSQGEALRTEAQQIQDSIDRLTKGLIEKRAKLEELRQSTNDIKDFKRNTLTRQISQIEQRLQDRKQLLQIVKTALRNFEKDNNPNLVAALYGTYRLRDFIDSSDARRSADNLEYNIRVSSGSPSFMAKEVLDHVISGMTRVNREDELELERYQFMVQHIATSPYFDGDKNKYEAAKAHVISLEGNIAADEADIVRLMQRAEALDAKIQEHAEEFSNEQAKWTASKEVKAIALRNQYETHYGHARIQQLEAHYATLIQQASLVVRAASK